MENPVTIPDTPAIRLVEKPKSNWSGLLNGAGNGAMIGGAGLLAYNIREHIKTGTAREPLFLMAAGITGLGTVIGAIYGYQEAKQINTYRAALAKDIETLHAQVDGLQAQQSR